MRNAKAAGEDALKMDYLAYQLAWWLLAAFVIGLVIGWISCERVDDGGR